MLHKVWKMSWKFILTPINIGKAGKGENQDFRRHEIDWLDLSIEREPHMETDNSEG